MLASSASAGGYVVIALVAYFGVSVPAFVVGRRANVNWPGIAFIPLVGPWIVIMWSIERSGWLVILTLIPLVNLVFEIWAAFTIPSEHGRTKWWALAFLIPVLNLVSFWVYAFTLVPKEPPALFPAATA